MPNVVGGQFPSEIKFFVKSEEITASEEILAGFSPVLGSMMQYNRVIHLPDDDPAGFRYLVKYTHYDDPKPPSLEVAMSGYHLGNRYYIQGLKDVCRDYIWENFDRPKGLNIYECFALNDTPLEFALKVLEVCQFSAEEILQGEHYLSCKIERLIVFFASTNLNISSEFTLVMALARYKEANESCSMDKINGALKNIRVLSIEPSVMLNKSNVRLVSKIINLKEYIEYKVRKRPEDDVPLPATFNPSKECRSTTSWTGGDLQVFLRDKAFVEQETRIKKYTTSTTVINTTKKITLRGVVLGLAHVLVDYVIPELDVVVTVQKNQETSLTGERFRLTNVGSKGIKCFFKDAVDLTEGNYYYLGFVFMNDVCTLSAHNDKEIFINKNCSTLNLNVMVRVNPAIHSILKGFIISFDPSSYEYANE